MKPRRRLRRGHEEGPRGASSGLYAGCIDGIGCPKTPDQKTKPRTFIRPWGKISQQEIPVPFVNVPTAEEYNRAAKSAFFAGWNELFHLIADFEHFFQDEKPNTPKWRSERARYYSHSTAEIEKVCLLASQASELALKAKICEVSPYLLLLGSDVKFKVAVSDVDFKDLRTLDAVDLVLTVNSVSTAKLTPQFADRFNELRTWRNKIMHQGTASVALDPKEIACSMAEQYAELWPEGRFVNEWAAYLSTTRSSFFHDHKWSTPHMELAEMFDVFFKTLETGNIASLTGIKPKNKRRYLCHECQYRGSIDHSGLDPSELLTCYLETPDSLRCLICEDVFSVHRNDCVEDNCKGNVISAAGDYEGMCHTCGGDQPG
jgi:hypothetical protein